MLESMLESMLERKSLGVDPLFSNEYFAVASIEKEIKPADFPLPDSPENIEDFFNSKDGAIFKLRMQSICDKLKSWSIAHHVKASSLDSFVKSYINYHGTNLGTNREYFGLYTEGVMLLDNIVELITSGEVDDDYCVGAMTELLAKMGECAPGVHTYFYDTLASLLAFKNIQIEWMVHRRDTAQQIGLELFRKLRLHHSWDVHFPNAAINRYAEVLGLPTITDENIALIQQRESEGKIKQGTLEKFLRHFEKAIKPNYTLESLIGHHVAAEQVDELVAKLNSSPNDRTLILTNYELRLKKFGSSSRVLLHSDDLLLWMDDRAIYKKSWKSDYTLWAEIFNRLCQNPECVDKKYLKKITKLFKLSNGDSISYLSGRSLKFAVSRTPNDKNKKKCRAFLVSCVEALAEMKDKSRDLLDFIKSPRITTAQRREIIEAIAKCLASADINNEDDVTLQRQNLLESLKELFLSDTQNRDLILHIAVEHQFFDFISFADEHGVSLSQPDQERLVFRAVATSNLSLLKFLIAKKANVNCVKYGAALTPLILAVSIGDITSSALLLAAGAKPDMSMGSSRTTALIFTTRENKSEFCDLLINHGASLSLSDSNGATVFHHAAANGAADVLDRLLKADSSDFKSITDRLGLSPLQYALRSNQRITTQKLLDSGVDVKPAFIHGLDPDLASMLSRVSEVTTLRQQNLANLSHIPSNIISARNDALKALRKIAIYQDVAAYDSALGYLKEIENCLNLYLNYRPRSKQRIADVDAYTKILVAAYESLTGDATDVYRSLKLKESLFALSNAVKDDHKQHGALARLGLFATQSRLAKAIDRTIGEEFILRKKVIGQ